MNDLRTQIYEFINTPLYCGINIEQWHCTLRFFFCEASVCRLACAQKLCYVLRASVQVDGVWPIDKMEQARKAVYQLACFKEFFSISVSDGGFLR